MITDVEGLCAPGSGRYGDFLTSPDGVVRRCLCKRLTLRDGFDCGSGEPGASILEGVTGGLDPEDGDTWRDQKTEDEKLK